MNDPESEWWPHEFDVTIRFRNGSVEAAKRTADHWANEVEGEIIAVTERCNWKCPVCGKRCGGVKDHPDEHQCPEHSGMKTCKEAGCSFADPKTETCDDDSCLAQ